MSEPGRDADPGVLEDIARLAASHIATRRDARVGSPVDRTTFVDRLARYDFVDAMPTAAVAADLFEMLGTDTVRSDHPRYFGLFNPPALVAAIAGDLVTATVNPQLAVWGHAPAAADIERKLIDLFGRRIWTDQPCAGTFTSGGSEANHSAVLVALARRYPDWHRDGIPTGVKPAIYVSSEAHLAWIKIARATGLGDAAVRLVTPADGLALSADTLRTAIAADSGADPLMIVATAGTTGHGGIDDIRGVAALGREIGSYVHVDAAWAGGALIDERRRALFDGIEGADSVTIDPHKWLAVPMGAGLFLSRDWAGLDTAFGVATGYMPAGDDAHRDAYVHSLQWSRRFIGGKLFTALATLGLGGYRAMIDRQFELGDRLRQGLRAGGWRILNDTQLPLVCFAPVDADDAEIRAIETTVVASGRAWLSSVRLRGALALRACITGFETGEEDVDALIDLLDTARSSVPA